MAASTENYDRVEREPKKSETILTKEDIDRAIITVEGDGLSHHTFEDIGRYTVFPKHSFERMFPGGKLFGTY